MGGAAHASGDLVQRTEGEGSIHGPAFFWVGRKIVGQATIVCLNQQPHFTKATTMSPVYITSVPVFKQMLGGLKEVLRKAEAHALEKKIDPNALLHARLFPDMFNLLRQVQVASDFAKSVSARLAGVDVPKMDDNEQTFADLQTRIDTVLTFIGGLDVAKFDEAAAREIITQAGTPKEKRFTGQSYLLNYGLPHFFFHTTTAFSILRHNGVDVGKKDYIGTY